MQVRQLIERFRALGVAVRGHLTLCNCEACRRLMEYGDVLSKVPAEEIEAAMAEMPVFRKAA